MVCCNNRLLIPSTLSAISSIFLSLGFQKGQYFRHFHEMPLEQALTIGRRSRLFAWAAMPWSRWHCAYSSDERRRSWSKLVIPCRSRSIWKSAETVRNDILEARFGDCPQWMKRAGRQLSWVTNLSRTALIALPHLVSQRYNLQRSLGHNALSGEPRPDEAQTGLQYCLRGIPCAVDVSRR